MKLNKRFLTFILVLALHAVFLSTSLYISTIEIVGFMSVGVVLAIVFNSKKAAAFYNILLITALQLTDNSLEYLLALLMHPEGLLPSFGKYMAKCYEGGILLGTVLLTLIITICIADMVKKLEERSRQQS